MTSHMKCEIATCALIDVYLLYLKKKKTWFNSVPKTHFSWH